jgi:hypothetical protein
VESTVVVASKAWVDGGRGVAEIAVVDPAGKLGFAMTCQGVHDVARVVIYWVFSPILR